MLVPAIVTVFLGLYAGLIASYFRAWKKLAPYIPSKPASVTVSVIIAARNEENTLPLLLRDLQAQDYPTHLFEVIVVNDFSTDATAAAIQGAPGNFRMIMPQCKPEESGKKKAIAGGVAIAKGDLILVTDADCRVGQRWLSTMAAFCQDRGAEFVAAPVKYTYQPGVLPVLQVLDFITLQGITAASVSSDFGTMCNGANLAYTKKAFQAVGGFAGIDKVPTGDDMLLMYKIWKQDKSKVFYLKSSDATVSTGAVATWKEFLMQRRRWASKTLVYDDIRLIVVLGFVLLFNLVPVALLILGFWQPVSLLYLLFFLAIKTAIEWPFVFAVARFFNQERLMRYFFFLQPLHVFYTVFVGIWSQLGGYEWKGRAAPGPSKGGGI
jgi:cellulose synthase/poly-beta-1,6-N-acetylglucosamine synthase-like glycosyltransferase